MALKRIPKQFAERRQLGPAAAIAGVAPMCTKAIFMLACLAWGLAAGAEAERHEWGLAIAALAIGLVYGAAALVWPAPREREGV